MDFPSPDSEELSLPENKEFVAYLSREIDGFLKTNGNSNTIMLFPPFNSYKRLLLHHLVESSYNNCGLSTFSIGQEPRRRTVVCLGSLRKNVLDDDANESKTHRSRPRVSGPDERKTPVRTSPAKSVESSEKPPDRLRKSRKTISYYVPPHLRKSSLESEPVSKKEKKTDDPGDNTVKFTENDANSVDSRAEEAKTSKLAPASHSSAKITPSISYYIPPHLRKSGIESESVLKNDNIVNDIKRAENSADSSPEDDKSSEFSTTADLTSALKTKIVIEPETLDSDWDPLYCGKGICSVPNVVIPILDDSEVSDITKEVGRVRIVEIVGPTLEEAESSEYVNGSMVEIYDLDDVRTDDLVQIFGDFVDRGFRLRWIDSGHALGIFSSSKTAEEALSSQFARVKIRPISQGTSLSQEIARNVVLPSSFRPKTCSSLAKRLLSGALGLKVSPMSPEERAAQKERLREVKDLRRKLTPS